MGAMSPGVDLGELVHMDQDFVEVFGEFRDFFFAELQVGEIGDVTNFLFGDLHAISLRR